MKRIIIALVLILSVSISKAQKILEPTDSTFVVSHMSYCDSDTSGHIVMCEENGQIIIKDTLGYIHQLERERDNIMRADGKMIEDYSTSYDQLKATYNNLYKNYQKVYAAYDELYKQRQAALRYLAKQHY